MKGQQISPWSIYNQQISDYPLLGLQPESSPTKLMLPKLKTKISSELPSQYSVQLIKKKRKIRAASTLDDYINRCEANSPSKRKEMVKEVEVKEQQIVTYSLQQMQQAEQNLKRQLQNKALTSIILNNLISPQLEQVIFTPQKKQKQLDWQRSVRERQMRWQKQKDKQMSGTSPRSKGIINLPTIKPKLNVLKSCIISTCDDQYQNVDLNQEALHKILKQKIDSMISQKMKVISRQKKIISRISQKPHNFC